MSKMSPKEDQALAYQMEQQCSLGDDSMECSFEIEYETAYCGSCQQEVCMGDVCHRCGELVTPANCAMF